MSIANPPAQVRRLGNPRLVSALALFGLGVALFCVIAAFVLVRQADDRQQNERRAALLSAMSDIRASGADLGTLDPQTIRSLERTAGLKDLRFETGPASAGREMQPMLGPQGRIVGWFSWQPERTMATALAKLQPLLALTAICLIAFAAIASWQLSRAVRDFGQSERRAWRLAHEDMLTGLPNYRKMIELTEAALAARGPDEIVTFALLDLDRLNNVNDAFGHQVGDRLLRALAERLGQVLPAGAVGGRIDGDQFAVVMTASDVISAEAAVRVAAMSLARPFWLDEQTLQVGVTAGFAHAPMHAESRDEIIRRADLALRTAKRKSRGEARAFMPSMDEDFNDRLFIERELRSALMHNALSVHYQPVVSSDGMRIVGAEALLRWTHPKRGKIPPAVFVPVAEQAGLIGKLGDFVLRRALADARRWPMLTIAVNLSPIQVRDPGLVELVSNLLADAGVAPSRLTLEVTESVLLNPDEAEARLSGLRGLGVRLALDDFGTGYSSLSYLQRFKFDTLKIDKAFVDPLGRSADSQAMIQAIVALGRALGLKLLAEGVETEEQRVLLRLAGCDELQGYLFARPGPREALDDLLMTQDRALASRAAG